MIILEFMANTIGTAMDYVRQATPAPLSVSESGRLGFEVVTGDELAVQELCHFLDERGIPHNIDGEKHRVR